MLKYGWGIHFDRNSTMAIYAMESLAYEQWKNNPDVLHKKALCTFKK